MATWLERTKTKFTITTGDGVMYYPLSMNANHSDEFNVSEFNFRNLAGTLVEKRKPLGVTYDLAMIFQGSDNIDVGLNFQNSSRNSKYWVIKHPFYGTINVQPITPIYYDNGNDKLNTTKITVTVRETLTAPPTTRQSNQDTITANQQATANFYAAYFVNAVPIPSVKDVTQMHSDLKGFQQILKTVSTSINNVTNTYNQANAAINNAISQVQGAITAIQGYISLVANIADTVANRVTYLTNMFNYLASEVESLPNEAEGVINDLKNLWFTESGTCLSAICLASVTNITNTDYQYSSQVTSVIGQLVGCYNSYLASCDTLQTANGGEPGSWVADPQSIIALDNLVYYTLSTLYAYQANALQPKTVTLTRDNNVIGIAYEIYGLLSDDSTIDKIISDNNIGCSQLIQVPKGTQILYYA